eukprot:EG_transcript_12734
MPFLSLLCLLLLLLLFVHHTGAVWMSETEPQDDPSGCYWTGCYLGGCPSGYQEVTKEKCFFLGPNSEYCCPKGSPPPVLDFATFLLHALRSHAAYASSQEVESGIFPANLPVFDNRSAARVFVDGNSSFFVDYWHNGTQWVSIRGTDSIQDVLQDLDTALVFNEELAMNLHRGFLAYAIETMHSLRQLLDPAQPIRLTGHSLGGAVAPIVALLLQKDGFAITDVVTFGAPKFTDARGAQQAQQLPLLRVVVAGDPVPPLPPGNTYRQAGPEVILSNSTSGFQYLTAAQATFRTRRTEPTVPSDRARPQGNLGQLLRRHRMLGYLAEVYARQPVADPALGAALQHLQQQEEPQQTP